MSDREQVQAAYCVNTLVQACHRASFNVGWWDGTLTIDDDGAIVEIAPFVVPTKLMLTVSEIAEAMEGHRKNKMDDHLPHRKMVEVELADACIRIFDLAGALGLDLGGAIIEKMAYNAQRADHKRENRAAEGGKKY